MSAASNSNILLALDVIQVLTTSISSWQTAARDAISDGRDMTAAEVQTLRDADDAADSKLQAAIKAKADREAAGG